jgi:hypothetical protein
MWCRSTSGWLSLSENQSIRDGTRRERRWPAAHQPTPNNPAEPRVQPVAEVIERQVRDERLTL